MKFAFFTLGCKVNQYETQAMEQWLLAHGHTLGDPMEPCDGFVINTCTVTAVSDKKSRNLIRRVRKRSPDAVVGVCGCYAQTSPEELRELNVDVLAGTSDRLEFLAEVVREAQTRTRIRAEILEDATAHRRFEILPAGGLSARTRAMLKVEDGCCNFCTYCIIPFARGPVRSLPLADAIAQANALSAEGYQELVVTGIEISSWGADFPEKPGLVTLIESLCAAVPSMRIRLGSLEPRTVTEEFCQRLGKFPNLCPQFHLSLQSGADAVLLRMHRKYDTARYAQSVRLLRTFFPNCAITTDLIVAFPGETEEEFHQSLGFLEDCAFSLVHVFPYSRRTGTPAANLPGQHPNAAKQARSAMAVALAQLLEQRYHQSMVGSVAEVLFEQQEGDVWSGYGTNYVKVLVEAQGQDLHNQVRQVHITATTQGGVQGCLIPS